MVRIHLHKIDAFLLGDHNSVCRDVAIYSDWSSNPRFLSYLSLVVNV